MKPLYRGLVVAALECASDRERLACVWVKAALYDPNLTVRAPALGAPRPIRLGIKKDGVLRRQDLR